MQATDKICELELAQIGRPLTAVESARQLTIRPLIAEVRVQRAFLSQLLSELGLPDTDEQIEAKQVAAFSAPLRSR